MRKLIIPFYLMLYKNNFSILFFLIAIGLHILIWFITPIESLFYAKSNISYNLRKYNNCIFYFIYAALTAALLFLSFYLIKLFFSIEEVQISNMNPSLVKNDFILINKYSLKDAETGDIIRFQLNESDRIFFGRIIALAGDSIRSENNELLINDIPLMHGIIPDVELKKTGIKNQEDLFYEVNNKRKYHFIG